MEPNALPDHWGKDPVSEFLHYAHHNTVASFAELKGEVELLREVDQIFRTFLANLNNSPHWFAGLFVLKAHSAFLAVCRLALSGQVSETLVLLRSVLENALYGSYVARNAGAGEIWLRRHDDEASMKAMKSMFTISNMLKDLSVASAKDAEVAGKLFQRTIDFGGHPNEQALTQSLKMDKLPNAVKLDVVYLHGPSLPMAHALKSAAQVGTCALAIFRPTYKERFDLLGLTEKLDALKAKL